MFNKNNALQIAKMFNANNTAATECHNYDGICCNCQHDGCCGDYQCVSQPQTTVVSMPIKAKIGNPEEFIDNNRCLAEIKEDGNCKPYAVGYDDYYDDFITDRIISMREIESTYTPYVRDMATIMRSSNALLMDELDKVRRTEMATMVEYNTQVSTVILQTMADMYDELSKKINSIEQRI